MRNYKMILAYDGSRYKGCLLYTSIQDEYVVANLERIILDERLHIEIIEQLYEKYVKTAIPRVLSLIHI